MSRFSPFKQQFKITLPPELAALARFLGRGDASQGMLIALDRLTIFDKKLLDDARMQLHREQEWARIEADEIYEAERPKSEEENRLATIWDDFPTYEDPQIGGKLKEQLKKKVAAKKKGAATKNTK